MKIYITVIKQESGERSIVWHSNMPDDTWKKEIAVYDEFDDWEGPGWDGSFTYFSTYELEEGQVEAL